MSNRTHQFILLVNNFSGISFFSYNRKRLRISRPMIIFTILNNFIINIAVLFLFTQESFMERYFVSEISSISASIFSKLLVLVGSGSFYLVSAVICISHILKRHQVLDFFKDCIALAQTIDNFCDLEKVFRRNLILIIAYISVMLVGATSVLIQKFWIAVGFCYATVLPYAVMLCFLNFVKMAELFFSVCLKIFRNNLKLFRESDLNNQSKCPELILQYDKLFTLNRNFNKTFGFSLSIMTSCLTAAILTQVPTQLDFLSIRFLVFHFFSCRHFKQLQPLSGHFR